MIFTPAPLEGAYIVDIERKEDTRGFFARTWCCDEMPAHGLTHRIVQCSIAFNHRRGTLRGMHCQVAPCQETKLVRCTMGSMFAVGIDLRSTSSTFKKYFHVMLTAENHRSVYIPEGFAFGYQTLADNTEVFYQMSQRFMPECARGVRWDDPVFGIAWPDDERIILDRDRNYPDFTGEQS